MGVVADRLAPLVSDLQTARQSGDPAAIRAARRALYAARAQELADAAPVSITRGNWTLTFLSPPRVLLVRGTPLLAVQVALHRNGVPVPVDGDIRIVNPPFQVPDGTGGYREDARAALADVLVGALARQVRGLR